MTSGNGAASGSVHLRVERTRSGAFIETVHSGTGNVKDTVLLLSREVDQLIMQLATLAPFSRDYAYPGAVRDAMHIPSAIERRAADAARRARERGLLAPPETPTGPEAPTLPVSPGAVFEYRGGPSGPLPDPDPMAGVMDPEGGAQDGEL